MITLSPDKKRVISIGKIIDDKGRPAAIDGKPEFSITPSTGVAIFPASDGMSCEVQWTEGSATPSVLVCTIDADTGEGVKQIVKSLDILPTFPQASDFEFTVGEETDAA